MLALGDLVPVSTDVNTVLHRLLSLLGRAFPVVEQTRLPRLTVPPFSAAAAKEDLLK